MARKKIIVEETQSEETTQENNNNEEMKQPSNQTSLDEEFNNMQQTQAQFEPEKENDQPTENNSEGRILNPAEILKIRMFLGFGLYFVAGLNVFLLDFVKKCNVPVSKISFTDEEKESILPYVSNVEFLQLIDKIPTWMFAVIHIEMMVIAKYNAVCDEYKKPVKEKKR